MTLSLSIQLVSVYDKPHKLSSSGQLLENALDTERKNTDCVIKTYLFSFLDGRIPTTVKAPVNRSAQTGKEEGMYSLTSYLSSFLLPFHLSIVCRNSRGRRYVRTHSFPNCEYKCTAEQTFYLMFSFFFFRSNQEKRTKLQYQFNCWVMSWGPRVGYLRGYSTVAVSKVKTW